MFNLPTEGYGVFTIDDWYEVDNHLSLFYKGDEFCFVCDGGIRGPLLWEPQYGNSFFVRLRFEPDCDEGEIILSWGWEHSTLHDAIVWEESTRFEPFDQPATGEVGLQVIAVHKSQLIHSIKREVRRVAPFANPECKRALEFAELRAAFGRVVSGWEEFLKHADIEPHLQESPHSKPELHELPWLQECMVAHGANKARLHQDTSGWRIDVKKQLDAPYEVWRFVETTDAQRSDRGYVHTRDMTEDLSWVLALR